MAIFDWTSVNGGLTLQLSMASPGLPIPTVCALQVDGVFWWNFLMETRSWDGDETWRG